MKYFSVNKEELSGMLKTGEIYSDGTYVNGMDDIEARSVVIGYSVSIYNEQGLLQNVEFYPVKVDVGDFTTNEDKVLNTIKEIYSADEGWQNNNW